jgi:hypothetical protein
MQPTIRDGVELPLGRLLFSEMAVDLLSGTMRAALHTFGWYLTRRSKPASSIELLAFRRMVENSKEAPWQLQKQ